MHCEAYGWVRRWAGPRRFVLDIGSANINGTVRPLFAGSATYIGIDIAAGDGVDVVADGRTYNPPEAPDLIVCCEVLEHCEQPGILVSHAWEVLAPGGTLIVTCAGVGRAVHGSDGGPIQKGETYTTVFPCDLAVWLETADKLEIVYDRERGDIFAAARKCE